MDKLYFVRHGQSEANLKGIIAGQSEYPLTDLGKEQAVEVGRLVKEKGISIDIIISSPIQRAHDTAVLAAEGFGYEADTIQSEVLAMERYFGLLQGQPKEVLRDMTYDEVVSYGAESEEDILNRARSLYALASRLEGNVLIVSHNGLGRRLRAVVEDKDISKVKSIPNAKLLELI